MGEKEWTPANVLDLFGDSIARATLVIANDRTVAVKDLADEFDVSDPTVYRRIDPLVDANLLQEHVRLDQNGNQHKEYETIIDEVTLSIDEDGYTVDLQIRQDLADDFESMLADLGPIREKTDTTHLTEHSRSNDHRGDPT